MREVILINTHHFISSHTCTLFILIILLTRQSIHHLILSPFISLFHSLFFFICLFTLVSVLQLIPLSSLFPSSSLSIYLFTHLTVSLFLLLYDICTWLLDILVRQCITLPSFRRPFCHFCSILSNTRYHLFMFSLIN